MGEGQDWDTLSATLRQEFEWKLNSLPWTLETQADDVEVSRGRHDGVTCWKCEAVLAVGTATPVQVFQAYYEWEHRLRWDKAFHPDSGLVQQLGERRTLDYSRTVPVLSGVISPRDFVDIREWTFSEDDHDTILAWGGSVTHESKPAVSGVVRGHNYPCGTKVAREGSEGRVRVTLLWQSDIKGWVPARAVDQAMGQQMLLTIAGLRSYLATETGSEMHEQ